MSFDHASLSRVIAAVGPVIRVVLAEVRGSTPRGVGTAMLVWQNGQEGTIGGGALEFEAARRARAMLAEGRPRAVWTLPLGPGLGQCCGGAVVILAERYAAAPEAAAFPLARPVTATGPAPGRLAQARETAADTRMIEGWLIEPLAAPHRQIWIWGAGHVGRALVPVLAPLPEFQITWVDTTLDRFPATVPEGVTCLPAADPALALPLAPKTAEHLILTYSHDMDLALCHAALRHGFRFCGLIGSETKKARFRARLGDLGHADAEISRITCPIGDPSLGKHPQAIAVGVAAWLLNKQMMKDSAPGYRATGTTS